MWTSVVDHGLQWCGRLLVFAQGDFLSGSCRTLKKRQVEVTAVLMVLSLIIAAAAILAKSV
jgi:hypothetical protein